MISIDGAAIAFIGVLLGWFLTMTSGALFAYLIFRTKREPHESLFQLSKPKGDAFVIDQFEDQPLVRPNKPGVIAPETDDAAKMQDAMNQKFLDQLAARDLMVKAKELETEGKEPEPI